MKIWVHTLVKNEERYIWYAVMSVIDHVDKILIWDTGSNDLTPVIVKKIKEIFPEKVSFKQVGTVDSKKYTKISQEMIEGTRGDWILILDGDEVWWEESIRKLVKALKGSKSRKLDSIVSPYYNVIGDIYHYQEKTAGKYKIDGRRGHLSIRAFRREIPGIHFSKEHGQRGLYDENGRLIQERSRKRRIYLNLPYLHFTNMQRSSDRKKDLEVSKRAFKFKYELGTAFPKDFYYPEVFFRPKPEIIPEVWSRRDVGYRIRAAVETPLKKGKRRLFSSNKSGY